MKIEMVGKEETVFINTIEETVKVVKNVVEEEG